MKHEITQTQCYFKKGSATLCILALLRQKRMYGYELTQALISISEGKFVLPEGTLYPILYRLEDYGYLIPHREPAGRRMTRVYYTLSAAGEAYYTQLLEDYTSIHAGVEKILSCKLEDDA